MQDGQIIANRYEIIRTIGQGGMGDVFQGRDRQTGDLVAIKLLKPDIVEEMPDLLERFRREGEALRKLNHPNIVKMLDAVEENGLHYLIMQYVVGGSLRDLLDRHPQLPVDQVLAIGIELADALTRAHHLKIIHRDLKPENVLLTDEGTPLLTDFGVARIGTRTRVTETGSVIGTYNYLSPEACMGEDLDQRTDIWSFGVMLYEMLAGQRPFDASQSTAVLLAILNNPLPDLAAVRPDVPPSLADLISRMLHKEREGRLPSVRVVGAALEAIQEGTDESLPGILPLPGQPGDPESRFATPTPAITHSVPAPEEDDLVIISSTSPLPTPTPGPALDSAITPPISRRWQWLAIGGMITALVVSMLAVVAVLTNLTGNQSSDARHTPVAAANTPLPTVPSGQQPPPNGTGALLPVLPGNYLVLVAQLDALGGPSDPTINRFLVDDLTRRLEREIPFSNLSVRPYLQPISSDEEARTVSEAEGAAVIVWGSYGPQGIDLNVQVGTLSVFPHMPFDRDLLEQTTNTALHMAAPREASAALPVLTVMTTLVTADGDAFEVGRMQAMRGMINLPLPEITSGGIAGPLQQAAYYSVTDLPQSIPYYDATIELQAGNPLLYCFRSSAYLQLGETDKALRDVETARRLKPDGWATPYYLGGYYALYINDLDTALQEDDKIVALRPDDWFAYFSRGGVNHLLGRYDDAWPDLEQAIALGPDVNFPYIPAALIALRQGRFADAQDLVNLTLKTFPDPSLSARLIHAIYGERANFVLVPMLSAASYLVLGQYDAAVTDSQRALAMDDQDSDVYLVEGLAYCNLGDLADAEQAYTRGIDADPTFTMLYALRAEVRARQGDVPGSLHDSLAVQQSDQADVYAPLMAAGVAGDWTCEKMFSFDYSQLGTEP
jgi:serine/threonine protein kinase/tetratricopeptide (TPR) repeat protein